jgi:hypothetical protein
VSGPPGAFLSRGWKPSAYQAAVVLSGVSAALGLGRELLVYQRLGLTTANDDLQFALSITYTIALLGEPLRLAALNLLQRHVGRQIWTLIASGILLAALVTTILYRIDGGDLPRGWLVVAGTAGAANLFLSWVLPRRQREGPFLPVHAVTVMPNVLMVAVLLLPAPSAEAFATRVVVLFLAAPLTQLLALAALRRFGDHPPLDPVPSVAEGLGPIAWHSVGAAGGQVAQVFLRTALRAGPPGTLTAFSMTLRVTDTLRAIFVDTYIASRVRRWAAGERSNSPVIDGRWLGGGALAAVSAGALIVALAWSGSSRWFTPEAAMLVIGMYLVLALRVRYQSLNTSAQPLLLVRRMAGVELATALVVGILSIVPGAPLALLPWAMYVAKPALGLKVASSPAAGEPLPAPEA